MQRASGELKQGEKIEPEQELRWFGDLLFPDLFDGEHIFSLEPVEVNRVLEINKQKGWTL